jgi:very-short-patch-repair endonuclease
MKIDPELIDLYTRAAEDRGLYFDGYEMPYRVSLTKYSQTLRKNMTVGEKRVWGFLKTLGVKVRAQYPIDNYIVDFYLHRYRLVIEIDGEQHFSDEGKEYDAFRDEILESYQLEVMRIANRDIISDMNGVCSSIRKQLQQHQ